MMMKHIQRNRINKWEENIHEKKRENGYTSCYT